MEKNKADKMEEGAKDPYAGLFERLDIPFESSVGVDLSKNDKYKKMHEGHRERVRLSADRDPDFYAFSDHEVLEYLIFNTVSRGDVNPIAHDLINTFGNLSTVLNSSIDELMKIPYVSEKTARMLTCIVPAARKAEIARVRSNIVVTNTSDVIEFLQPYFTNRNNEMLFLLSLSTQNRIVKVDVISDGMANYTPIDMRKIMFLTFKNQATKVILAHNHPSGECLPSKDDIEATSKIVLALSTAGVYLLDHIIFTPVDFYSFFTHGDLEKTYVVSDSLMGTTFVKQMGESNTLVAFGDYGVGQENEFLKRMLEKI